MSPGGQRRRAAPRSGSGGFTLLEVVVALAILAAGILAVLDLFSGSLRLTEGARDVAAAQVYASQRMEEALLAPHPEPGVDRGAFGEKYRWETTTTREPADADGGFREVRIRVTVSWDDGPRERTVGITASRWERKRLDEQG